MKIPFSTTGPFNDTELFNNKIRLLWYYEWYMNILVNNKSDFSGILNGIRKYRPIPLDRSMIRSGFTDTLNGI